MIYLVVMSTETGERTAQEILESIEKLLFKIEDHLAPPPLWQRIIRFIFQHLFLFLTLLALAYFTWKIWGTIEYVSTNVNFIRDSVSGLGTSITEKLNDLKFWK